MSALPIKKIYRDTKFRRNDSKSTSDFKIDLPQTLKLPENCVCYIDDVSIPRSWFVVETCINDKLHLRLQYSNGGILSDHIITLQSKNYNGSQFASELQGKLQVINNTFTCLYDNQSMNVSISLANLDVKLFTDAELMDSGFMVNWSGTVFNQKNLSSANELLTNVTPNVIGNTASPAQYYLNLTSIRNIYIRSPNISSFNTIGCNGESSIIKKVPINAAPGEMITSFITSGTDFIPCNNLTLKTIEIQLVDVNGNIINLHNNKMSFSILFDLMNSDQ